MAPRRPYVQPLSSIAVWARRLAFFSIPVALLAVIVERTGIFEIYPVLATFGASLVLAGLAVLLGLLALAVIWFTGDSGAGRAVIAIVLGLMLLAYPGYLGAKAYRLPQIYDVTTDPYDPPRFEAVARLRGRDANPVAYPGLATYSQQRQAWPDIEPIDTQVNAQVTYDTAMAIVTKHKWRVVDARPPQQASRREGRIEAIAQSPIMGFRDDVVIRIRPTGNASARFDVRSSSRYGFLEFGDIASRFTNLIDDIDDAASPDKIERAARRAAARAAQQQKLLREKAAAEKAAREKNQPARR
jgi:uncharacterized protein (DUF1499 family)